MLQELIASVQSGIGSLPKEHFEELKNKMFEELRHVDEEIASSSLRSSSQ
jgi:hypothetical protein